MPSPRDDEPDCPTQRLHNTRRRFLAGSAGTLGGLALGGTFATPVLASDDDDDEGPPELPESDFEDDVDILNYALTLELLEASFYEEALSNISEADLEEGPLADFGTPITNSVYDNLGTVRDHEVTHAETLTAVIEDLGGDPVEEPTFEFGAAVEDPTEFLATAVALEDTGVAAYAGAAPYIENADLVTPALSIHSVEARHASYLRVLDQQVPFPEPFDDPLPKSEVLEIASQFIVEE